MTPPIILQIVLKLINSCNTIEQIDTCVRFASKVLEGVHLKMAEQSARVKEGDLIIQQLEAA